MEAHKSLQLKSDDKVTHSNIFKSQENGPLICLFHNPAFPTSQYILFLSAMSLWMSGVEQSSVYIYVEDIEE